jgi:hypothetical protein
MEGQDAIAAMLQGERHRGWSGTARIRSDRWWSS